MFAPPPPVAQSSQEKKCNCAHFQEPIINSGADSRTLSFDWHCPVHGTMHKDFDQKQECCKHCACTNHLNESEHHCAVRSCSCHRQPLEKQDWKSECCGAPFVISKDTLKGTHRLCNACGKDWPKPHQPSEAWEEEFSETIKNRMRSNNDCLLRNEIPWIGAFIRQKIAEARGEGVRGVPKLVEVAKRRGFEAGRTAALKEIKLKNGDLASAYGVGYDAALKECLEMIEGKIDIQLANAEGFMDDETCALRFQARIRNATLTALKQQITSLLK